MRGKRETQSPMLVLMSPEDLVPKNHPIRCIKKRTDEALRELSPVFDEMYASVGRPSIPPERLLKSSLLIALNSDRASASDIPAAENVMLDTMDPIGMGPQCLP